MRPTLGVIVLLLAPIAAAQGDARLEFLTKQLSGAKDPRARAQTATVMGASKNPQTVKPLCAALKDPEPMVRNAVARALGELKDPSSAACLKEAKADPDPDVKASVLKALEALVATATPAGPPAGSLYIALEPIGDKTGTQPPEVLKLTDELLRAKLVSMGATIAPAGEDKAAATALIRSRKLKGYLVFGDCNHTRHKSTLPAHGPAAGAAPRRARSAGGSRPRCT